MEVDIVLVLIVGIACDSDCPPLKSFIFEKDICVKCLLVKLIMKNLDEEYVHLQCGHVIQRSATAIGSQRGSSSGVVTLPALT